MATDFTKYGSPLENVQPITKATVNIQDKSSLQEFSTGFVKSGLGFARNVAGGLQDVGQRVLAGVTPNKTYQDIKQTTGIKSISDTTKEGREVKQILEPEGTAQKLGAFIGEVAQFAIPAGRVAKATKGLGKATQIGGQVASDVGVAGIQTGSVDEAKKVGIASGILTTVPVLGKLISPTAAKGLTNVAKKIEEINLRLTPPQKLALERQSNDIVGFLTKNKIVGSPKQRYQKALNLVDSFEDTIQTKLKQSGKEYTKDEIITAVKNIPEEYLQTVENPDVYKQMTKGVDDFIDFINKQKGETIPATRINQFKRNYAKNARNKAGDVVLNESREAISDGLYGILQKDIKELKPINREYAKALIGTKLLGKAVGRNELGLIGNLIGIASGTTVGGAIGGPVGGAVGAAVAPQVGKTLIGTQTRSRVGAGLQKLSEYLQNPKTDINGDIIIPKSVIESIISQ